MSDDKTRQLRIASVYHGIVITLRRINWDTRNAFDALAAVRDAVPDCTPEELKTTQALFDDDAHEKMAFGNILLALHKRFPAGPNETTEALIRRAAAAGDPEAIALMSRHKL